MALSPLERWRQGKNRHSHDLLLSEECEGHAPTEPLHLEFTPQVSRACPGALRPFPCVGQPSVHLLSSLDPTLEWVLSLPHCGGVAPPHQA